MGGDNRAPISFQRLQQVVLHRLRPVRMRAFSHSGPGKWVVLPGRARKHSTITRAVLILGCECLGFHEARMSASGHKQPSACPPPCGPKPPAFAEAEPRLRAGRSGDGPYHFDRWADFRFIVPAP